jgi:hypothetical protein
MNIRKVKNGQAILPNNFLSDRKSIPLLKDKDMQRDLKYYLESGNVIIPQMFSPPVASDK